MTEENNDELYNRVLAMVRKHTGRKFITAHSRLYQDLGADGTDAYELMVKLKEDFEVDMTNFVFENHFGAEHGFNPLVWIVWLLFEREKLNDKGAVKKIPITVLDLYESAKIKKWPEVGDKKPE
jgi:acyl carrier protein